jgi:pimeloyl-ACP methyl ester carboxylesterase
VVPAGKLELLLSDTGGLATSALAVRANADRDQVLPALAEHFTVLAPDLRGSGGSDAPVEGYDKATLAEDLHQLLVGLELADEVSLVGHDIGTMVAYAYAVAHRDSTHRLVLMEAPLADEGLYAFPSITRQGPGLWNFGFFTLDNGLPERMLAGCQTIWVQGFVDWLEVVKGGVGEQAIAEYAAHLTVPGRTRATFEYFRAFDADVVETARHRATPLSMPVLAIGAQAVMGQAVHDQVIRYATDVTGEVVPCGHWIAEENPEHLTGRLLAFLVGRPASELHSTTATVSASHDRDGSPGRRRPGRWWWIAGLWPVEGTERLERERPSASVRRGRSARRQGAQSRVRAGLRRPIERTHLNLKLLPASLSSPRTR